MGVGGGVGDGGGRTVVGGEGSGLWWRRGEGGRKVGEDNTGGGSGKSEGARV